MCMCMSMSSNILNLKCFPIFTFNFLSYIYLWFNIKFAVPTTHELKILPDALIIVGTLLHANDINKSLLMSSIKENGAILGLNLQYDVDYLNLLGLVYYMEGNMNQSIPYFIDCLDTSNMTDKHCINNLINLVLSSLPWSESMSIINYFNENIIDKNQLLSLYTEYSSILKQQNRYQKMIDLLFLGIETIPDSILLWESLLEISMNRFYKDMNHLDNILLHMNNLTLDLCQYYLLYSLSIAQDIHYTYQFTDKFMLALRAYGHMEFSMNLKLNLLKLYPTYYTIWINLLIDFNTVLLPYIETLQSNPIYDATMSINITENMIDDILIELYEFLSIYSNMLLDHEQLLQKGLTVFPRCSGLHFIGGLRVLLQYIRDKYIHVNNTTTTISQKVILQVVYYFYKVIQYQSLLDKIIVDKANNMNNIISICHYLIPYLTELYAYQTIIDTNTSMSKNEISSDHKKYSPFPSWIWMIDQYPWIKYKTPGPPYSLHLGCSKWEICAHENYINIDGDGSIISHYIGSVSSLSHIFNNNSIIDIYSSHTLEHIPYNPDLAIFIKNRDKRVFPKEYRPSLIDSMKEEYMTLFPNQTDSYANILLTKNDNRKDINGVLLVQNMTTILNLYQEYLNIFDTYTTVMNHIHYIENQFISSSSSSSSSSSYIQSDICTTLMEWNHILTPGGRIRLSVPDLESLATLYISSQVTKKERVLLMSIIYGGQNHPYNIHYTGFDESYMIELLLHSNYCNITRIYDGDKQSTYPDTKHSIDNHLSDIKKDNTDENKILTLDRNKSGDEVNHFSEFSDTSRLRIYDKLMSLNIIAYKCDPSSPYVEMRSTHIHNEYSCNAKFQRNLN